MLIISTAVAGTAPVFGHPFDPFAEDKQGALALILAHLRDGELHEALLQADDAVGKFPKHGPFYALKAQILLRQGKTDDAEQAVQRAVELSPDYALAYWIRGLVHQQRGQYAPAIDDFSQAIEREDQNEALKIQATGSRGMALAALGRHREALADLDRAIEARPNSFAERQFRAESQLALAQWASARVDIEHLLAMDAKNPLTLRLHGEWLLEQGRAQQALTALDSAIKTQPKDARAYRLRAQAHAKLKHRTAQQRDLAHACRLGDRGACAQANSQVPD